jgi:hypothetical protein
MKASAGMVSGPAISISKQGNFVSGDFHKKFYPLVFALKNKITDSKNGIRGALDWTAELMFDSEAPSQMKELYNKTLSDINSILSDFNSKSPNEIISQLQSTLSLFGISGIELPKAFRGEKNIDRYKNVLRVFIRTINEMKGFISQKTQKKQESEKGFSLSNKWKEEYKRELENLQSLIRNNPLKISKVVGGDQEAVKLEDWIKVQLASADSDDSSITSEHSNNLRKFISQLNKNLSSVRSSYELSLFKKADFGVGAPPIELPGMSNKPSGDKKNTVKNVGGVGKSKNFNPKVKELQQKMVESGINIGGKNPVDGIWGMNTAAAFRNLLLMSNNSSIRDLSNRVELEGGNFPGEKILDIGFYVVNKLEKNGPKLKGMIPVEGFGILTADSLDNIDSFILELISMNALKRQDSRDVKLNMASDSLIGLYNKIKTDENFREELIAENKNVDFPNLVLEKVKNLLTLIQRENPSIIENKLNKNKSKPEQSGQTNESGKIDINVNQEITNPREFLKISEINDMKTFKYVLENLIGLKQLQDKNAVQELARYAKITTEQFLKKVSGLIINLRGFATANKMYIIGNIEGGEKKFDYIIELLNTYSRTLSYLAQVFKFDLYSSPQQLTPSPYRG